MPNRENEIHLDGNFTKRLIYNEYCDQHVERDDQLLSETSFCQMWKDTMPHVKIRKRKGVDSKCSICCDICLLRSKSTTREQRLELTKLFKYHRMTFMAERYKYYDRVRRAKVCIILVHISSLSPFIPISLPLLFSFTMNDVILCSLSNVSNRKSPYCIFHLLETGCNSPTTCCHIWQTQGRKRLVTVHLTQSCKDY
jgi:hypothetical protein